MVLLPDPIFEVRKDPYAERTYGFDYQARGWLGAGETITSSIFEVSPAGLTLSNPANTTTTTGVLITGGTADVDYRVTNKIITNQGKDARSFTVKVRPR